MTHPPTPDTRSPAAVAELVFEFTDPSHFLVSLSADQSCLVRLERSVRLDGAVNEFFTSQGACPDAIHGEADRRPSIESVRLVYEWGPEIMFRITTTDPSIEQTFEAVGAIPQTIVARDGTGTASALVPESVVTRDVVEYVSARYPSAELVKRLSRDLPAAVFTRGTLQLLVRKRLTDRQWEVLRTAHRLGYWDRPRGCTGEEVAEELGITSATFSQHVRAACDNIFDVLFHGADR